MVQMTSLAGIGENGGERPAERIEGCSMATSANVMLSLYRTSCAAGNGGAGGRPAGIVARRR
jgi:hypothetical protein